MNVIVCGTHQSHLQPPALSVTPIGACESALRRYGTQSLLCTITNQTICMNRDEVCVGGDLGSSQAMKLTHLHVSESSSGVLIGYVQHWRVRIHNCTSLHTCTHCEIHPRPFLERALVTPHKSTESQQYRRAERERVGDKVCRGLVVAAIFQHAQSLLDQDKS